MFLNISIKLIIDLIKRIIPIKNGKIDNGKRKFPIISSIIEINKNNKLNFFSDSLFFIMLYILTLIFKKIKKIPYFAILMTFLYKKNAIFGKRKNS